MTQGFRDKFAEVADFTIIDAPFFVDMIVSPPEPALLKKGFKPPFRGWFSFLTK
jgi:hypothetical protein